MIAELAVKTKRRSLEGHYMAATIDISQSLRKRLTRDSVVVFGIGVFSTGISFVTSIVLARSLGAQGYGVYAYAFTLVAVMQILANLGLPNLLVRCISAYRMKGEWGLMAGLLRRSLQAVLISTSLLIALGTAAAWLLGQRVSSEGLRTFSVALLMLPFLALTSLRSSVLRALFHAIPGQVPEAVAKPLLFLGLIAGAVLVTGGAELSPVAAMIMQLIATIISFAIGAWLLKSRLPGELWTMTPSYAMAEWRQSAFPLILTSGITVINTYTDILMLGAMKDSTSVGIYQVVARGATMLTFFIYAVNTVVAPVASGLYTKGETERLQRIVTLSTRIVLAMTCPIALLLATYPREILRSLFGAQFSAGAEGLAILSVCQMISVSMGSVWDLLIMTGHEKDVAKASAISASLNVALNAVLIPHLGINGAALATGMSTVLFSLMLAVAVYRRTGLYTTAIAGVKAARA